jgi:DNA-binding transcriptional regulator LsrR (DeoR family)
VGDTGSKKRTPAQMDDVAVAAARLHFEEDLEQMEVAARLHLSKQEVARFIKRARDRKLVSLRVEDPSLPRVDRPLSRRLEDLSGIRTVVAVRVTTRGAHSADASARPVDRHIHEVIATAAARYLWDRIRDHDHILVGAGRAVRFTVDALGRCASAEPRSFEGVQVTSLTGNPLVRRDPQDLDSDAITSELGHVLKLDGSAVHRVNTQYIARNPGRVLRQLGSSLMKPDWGGRVPDIALLGVGVLDSRHHLMSSSRSSTMMRPVRAILDRLEREVLPSGRSPVIDVYDTFWVREDALDPVTAGVARELVAELNSVLVAAPRSKVNQAREKIIIAGGAAKYEAILTLLQDTGGLDLRPTVLVIDSTTAARLIAALS